MQYRIVDGADQMNIDDIMRLLKMSYWADRRPREQVEASVRNSACYGIRVGDEDRLVGFARVISDYATTYYLCDVIVDEAYRGNGLGTALVGYIESLPAYAGLRGLLVTKDAHGLYRKFGYVDLVGRAMSKALNC